MRGSRVNFRKCRICHQGVKGKNRVALIQTCNCDSGSTYVHKRCQAAMMEKKGIIKCPDCKEMFRGLQYSFSAKNFCQYLWEYSNARVAMWTNICLLISMVVSLSSLFKTFLVEWDDFMNRIYDFDLLPLALETVKFDINIIMMVHLKLFLPISSVFLTTRQVWEFWLNYQKWRETYFNVQILEPTQS